MAGKSKQAWKLDRNMSIIGEPLKGIKWQSPKPPVVVAGFAWFKKEGIFRRLPRRPNWKINENVDSLANSTAGGQLLFRTDSKRLAIRVELTAPAGMYHMPATGQCGFDCYLGAPGKKSFAGTAKFDHTKLSYEHLFYEQAGRNLREITLNFPLYQGVKRVLIGTDPGSRLLSPSPYKNPGKIIFYGTSITQGGCASRPGMAFTNILSRRFNHEIINLGFSGNGRGEPELAKLILEIENPACYILDYEANCFSTELLKKTLPEFIKILRSRNPGIPLLVISRIPWQHESATQNRKDFGERRKFERETVKRLEAAGDKRIYFLDGSNLLGRDSEECTVDGAHPTDLGFMRMADRIEPVLKKILG